MKYGYYPGCSLEKNASAYHDSLMAIANTFELDFQELEDWNCCGATEYFALDLLPAYSLIGRNLAIAEQIYIDGNGNQLVAPCSACYLNLKKIDKSMAESPELAGLVNTALAEGDMHYTPDSVKVRHLLDIFANDIGYETIAEKVTKPLHNLRLAPYYGCLVARPMGKKDFDEQEYPVTMDELLAALGAEIVDFPLKAHCCGGHMPQISEAVALELIERILKNAARYEADAIVTLCPMCQLNLDAYQKNVNKMFDTEYNIPILYFTQMIGLAIGFPQDELGFGKEFIDATEALSKITEKPPKTAKPKRPLKGALPMPTFSRGE